MQKVIVDCEFTGLDNTFVANNEIVQVKMMNLKTKKTDCRSYSSEKPIGASARLLLGVNQFEGERFCKEHYCSQLEAIGISPNRKITYYGFGVQQDVAMLTKYDIEIDIVDIRQLLQRSRFAERMATEGSGLEAAYLIVFGKAPNIENHDGFAELHVIHDLYCKSVRLKKQSLLRLMPHGHCAGMPIAEYVRSYRRAADGYRFNNTDLLAKSLTANIPIRWRDDGWELEDEWDDD